jgi:hypothetical protein
MAGDCAFNVRKLSLSTSNLPRLSSLCLAGKRLGKAVRDRQSSSNFSYVALASTNIYTLFTFLPVVLVSTGDYYFSTSVTRSIYLKLNAWYVVICPGYWSNLVE